MSVPLTVGASNLARVTLAKVGIAVVAIIFIPMAYFLT